MADAAGIPHSDLISACRRAAIASDAAALERHLTQLTDHGMLLCSRKRNDPTVRVTVPIDEHELEALEVAMNELDL
jgi:DNA-binding transcriptional ArsR family regulator